MAERGNTELSDEEENSMLAACVDSCKFIKKNDIICKLQLVKNILLRKCLR